MSTYSEEDPIELCNPADVGHGSSLFVFWAGACGPTRAYVWADSVEDGLEEFAGWLKDTGKVGLFSEPDYKDAAEEIGAPEHWEQDDKWSEKVREHAEVDHTYTEAGWLLGWEWGVDDVFDDETIERVTLDSAKRTPNVEVFEVTADDFLTACGDDWRRVAMYEALRDDEESAKDAASRLAGWYWWTCCPGCLPDSEADGPHESETAAWKSAAGL